ncbi:MAG: amidohydrolase family protein [Chloroflexota bacterium]
MYDLLLVGGTVIDASQGLNARRDLAVHNGLIAAVEPSIARTEAVRVIDVTGKTVTPGLIDAHCHVSGGITQNGVHPDLAGVRAGVTTVVDAGTTGCATFQAFPDYIMPNVKTEIIPLMHICQTGLATTPDIIAESSIDLEGTLRATEKYRGLVRGIKARMVSPALEIFGMEMPRLAKRAAKESGLPLMVHIGDTEKRYDPAVIRELLPILEPGDIITHLFTPNPGGVLDANGRLLPELREVADRGIWLDTAHGRMNFGFDVGRRVLDQGMLPDCISTDLTVPGRLTAVHSLVEIMDRFLALGFDLEQVIAMVTVNPARVFGEQDRLGSLAVGRQADISVLELRQGRWTVYDTLGESLPLETAIVPVLTVKRGEIFEPEWGPHPWGWEPEPLVNESG